MHAVHATRRQPERTARQDARNTEAANAPRKAGRAVAIDERQGTQGCGPHTLLARSRR
jgi:hypothetical protein